MIPKWVLILEQADALQRSGQHEQAIILYQKILRQNPRYFDAYGKLLNSLKATKNPSHDYWLLEGVHNVPEFPFIAKEYCYYLLREKKYDEFEKMGWIERLQDEIEYNGFKLKYPRIEEDVYETKILRTYGIACASHSTNNFVPTVELLEEVSPKYHWCNLVDELIRKTCDVGVPQILPRLYALMCENCYDYGHLPKMDAALAIAYINAGMQQDAENASDVAVKKYTDEMSTLLACCYVYDRLGRFDKLLKTAQSLHHLQPSSKTLYGIINVCMRIGKLGLARQYCEESLQQENAAEDIYEALAFLKLLEGNIDGADKTWKEYVNLWANFIDKLISDNVHEHFQDYLDEARRSGCSHEELMEANPDSAILHAQQTIQCSLVQPKIDKWNALVGLAKRITHDRAYCTRLIQENVITEPLICCEVQSSGSAFTLDQITNALRGPSSENVEILWYFNMIRRGDYSAVVDLLRKDLLNYKMLPQEAFSALIESERNMHENINTLKDYFCEVVGYGKAVEVALKRIVFEPYRRYCNLDLNVFKHTEIVAREKNTNREAIIRFVERGSHLELGPMVVALEYAGGRTGRKDIIYGRLNEFVNITLKRSILFTAEYLKTARTLTKEMRNRAVHEKIMGREVALEARKSALWLLNGLLNPDDVVHK